MRTLLLLSSASLSLAREFVGARTSLSTNQRRLGRVATIPTCPTHLPPPGRPTNHLKSANAKSRDNKKLAAPAIVVGSEIWGGMVYSWAPEHVIAPLVVVVHYGYIIKPHHS